MENKNKLSKLKAALTISVTPTHNNRPSTSKKFKRNDTSLEPPQERPTTSAETSKTKYKIFLSPDYITLTSIIQILKIPPSGRTHKDIHMIQLYTSKLRFFHELYAKEKDKNGEEIDEKNFTVKDFIEEEHLGMKKALDNSGEDQNVTIQEIEENLNRMYVAHYQASQKFVLIQPTPKPGFILFKHKDPSQHFYVILEGRIGVLIKKKEKTLRDEVNLLRALFDQLGTFDIDEETLEMYLAGVRISKILNRTTNNTLNTNLTKNSVDNFDDNDNFEKSRFSIDPSINENNQQLDENLKEKNILIEENDNKEKSSENNKQLNSSKFRTKTRTSKKTLKPRMVGSFLQGVKRVVNGIVHYKNEWIKENYGGLKIDQLLSGKRDKLTKKLIRRSGDFLGEGEEWIDNGKIITQEEEFCGILGYELVNELHTGQGFGELGLIYNRFRGATAIILPPLKIEHNYDMEKTKSSKEIGSPKSRRSSTTSKSEKKISDMSECLIRKPTLILRLNKANYQKIFQRMQRMKETRKNEFIQKYILTDPAVSFLASSFGVMWEKKKYPAKTTILNQGEGIDYIHVLVNGRVKLRVVWKEILSGKSRLTLQKNTERIRRDEFIEVGVGECIGDECLFRPKKKKGKKTRFEKIYKKMADVENLPIYPYNKLSYEAVTETPCEFFVCEIDKFKTSCIVDDRILKFILERIEAKREHLKFLMKDVKKEMVNSRIMLRKMQNDNEIQGFEEMPQSMKEFQEMYKTVSSKPIKDTIIIPKESEIKSTVNQEEIKKVVVVDKKRDKYNDVNVETLFKQDSEYISFQERKGVFQPAKKSYENFSIRTRPITAKEETETDGKLVNLKKKIYSQLLSKPVLGNQRKIIREKKNLNQSVKISENIERHYSYKNHERRVRRNEPRSQSRRRARSKNSNEIKKSNSVQNKSIESIQTNKRFQKKITRFKKEHFRNIIKHTRVEKGNFFDQHVIFGNSKEEIRMGLTTGGLDLVRRRDRQSNTMKKLRSMLNSKKKAEMRKKKQDLKDLSELNKFYTDKQKLAKMITPYNTLDGTRKPGWNDEAVKILQRSHTEKKFHKVKRIRSKMKRRANSYNTQVYRKRYKNEDDGRMIISRYGYREKMPYIVKDKERLSNSLSIASPRGVLTSGIGNSNRVKFIPMVNGKFSPWEVKREQQEEDFDGQYDTFFSKLRTVKHSKNNGDALYMEEFDRGTGIVEDERRARWLRKKQNMKFTMIQDGAEEDDFMFFNKGELY